MKDFIFSDSLPDTGYTFDFEEAFFNTASYRQHQDAHHWLSFFVLNTKHQKVFASIHFHQKNGIARSPLAAPFGSFDASADIPAHVLFDFIQYTESELRARNVSAVIIKTPPSGLQNKLGPLVSIFLLNSGYRVSLAETGALIDLGSENPEQPLHSWEARKLRQAREASLTFGNLEKDDFRKVYALIAESRASKNYVLSMAEKDLGSMISIFPERFPLFGVFDKQELVAASVSIRIKKNILYNFYSDHRPAYDALSPAVLLLCGICHYCQQHDINVLDLGTSANGDKPNFGLLEFKMRLGAHPSPKFTFEKNLK